MVDPIADMLNRIRNAQAVNKETVVIPFSKIKYEIAKILKKNGLVGEIEKKGVKSGKIIRIVLKYSENKEPLISGLKRISKPGQRIYSALKDIKPARAGYGLVIISTSKGAMTGKEARKKKLGGEIICEVW